MNRYAWVEKSYPNIPLMVEGVLDREEKEFYPFAGLDIGDKREVLDEFESGNRSPYLHSSSVGHNFWEIDLEGHAEK